VGLLGPLLSESLCELSGESLSPLLSESLPLLLCRLPSKSRSLLRSLSLYPLLSPWL